MSGATAPDAGQGRETLPVDPTRRGDCHGWIGDQDQNDDNDAEAVAR